MVVPTFNKISENEDSTQDPKIRLCESPTNNFKLAEIINSRNIITDSNVITTRKRSLRRLCFHRCLSVHGGVCLWSRGSATLPLQADTPWQTPPWQTPPQPDTPQVDTPSGQIHPCPVHAGKRSTSHWNAFLFGLFGYMK